MVTEQGSGQNLEVIPMRERTDAPSEQSVIANIHQGMGLVEQNKMFLSQANFNSQAEPILLGLLTKDLTDDHRKSLIGRGRQISEQPGSYKEVVDLLNKASRDANGQFITDASGRIVVGREYYDPKTGDYGAGSAKEGMLDLLKLTEGLNILADYSPKNQIKEPAQESLLTLKQALTINFQGRELSWDRWQEEVIKEAGNIDRSYNDLTPATQYALRIQAEDRLRSNSDNHFSYTCDFQKELETQPAAAPDSPVTKPTELPKPFAKEDSDGFKALQEQSKPMHELVDREMEQVSRKLAVLEKKGKRTDSEQKEYTELLRQANTLVRIRMLEVDEQDTQAVVDLKLFYQFQELRTISGGQEKVAREQLEFIGKRFGLIDKSGNLLPENELAQNKQIISTSFMNEQTTRLRFQGVDVKPVTPEGVSALTDLLQRSNLDLLDFFGQTPEGLSAKMEKVRGNVKTVAEGGALVQILRPEMLTQMNASFFGENYTETQQQVESYFNQQRSKAGPGRLANYWEGFKDFANPLKNKATKAFAAYILIQMILDSISQQVAEADSGGGAGRMRKDA